MEPMSVRATEWRIFCTHSEHESAKSLAEALGPAFLARDARQSLPRVELCDRDAPASTLSPDLGAIYLFSRDAVASRRFRAEFSRGVARALEQGALHRAIGLFRDGSSARIGALLPYGFCIPVLDWEPSATAAETATAILDRLLPERVAPMPEEMWARPAWYARRRLSLLAWSTPASSRSGPSSLRPQDYVCSIRAARAWRRPSSSPGWEAHPGVEDPAPRALVVPDIRSALNAWLRGQEVASVELRGDDPACLLMGPPGSGKTWLLDGLEQDVLRLGTWDGIEPAFDEPLSATGDRRLPLRIEAGTVYSTLPEDAEPLQIFAAGIQPLLGPGEDAVEAWQVFAERLAILVLIDGLDQVPSASLRRKIADVWLNVMQAATAKDEGASARRPHRCIIASRPEECESWPDVAMIQIKALAETEVTRYASSRGPSVLAKLQTARTDWGPDIGRLLRLPLYLQITCRLLASDPPVSRISSTGELIFAWASLALATAARAVGEAPLRAVSTEVLERVALAEVLPGFQPAGEDVLHEQEIAVRAGLVRRRPTGELTVANRALWEWAIRQTISRQASRVQPDSEVLFAALASPLVADVVRTWAFDQGRSVRDPEGIAEVLHRAWRRNRRPGGTTTSTQEILLHALIGMLQRAERLDAERWVARLSVPLDSMSLDERTAVCTWAFTHPCWGSCSLALHTWLGSQGSIRLRRHAVAALAPGGPLRTDLLSKDSWEALIRGLETRLSALETRRARSWAAHEARYAEDKGTRKLGRIVDEMLARSLPFRPRVTRWARRHAILAGIPAVLFGALVVLLILALIDAKVLGGLDCAAEPLGLNQDRVLYLFVQAVGSALLLVIAFPLSRWLSWKLAHVATQFASRIRGLVREGRTRLLQLRLRRLITSRKLSRRRLPPLWEKISDPTLEPAERIARLRDWFTTAMALGASPIQRAAILEGCISAFRARHRAIARLGSAGGEPTAEDIAENRAAERWLHAYPRSLDLADEYDGAVERAARDMVPRNTGMLEQAEKPRYDPFPPVRDPLCSWPQTAALGALLFAYSASGVLRAALRSSYSDSFIEHLRKPPLGDTSLSSLLFDRFSLGSFALTGLVVAFFFFLGRRGAGPRARHIGVIAAVMAVSMIVELTLDRLLVTPGARLEAVMWCVVKIVLAPYFVGGLSVITTGARAQLVFNDWTLFSAGRLRAALAVGVLPVALSLLRPWGSPDEAEARVQSTLAKLDGLTDSDTRDSELKAQLADDLLSTTEELTAAAWSESLPPEELRDRLMRVAQGHEGSWLAVFRGSFEETVDGRRRKARIFALLDSIAAKGVRRSETKMIDLARDASREASPLAAIDLEKYLAIADLSDPENGCARARSEAARLAATELKVEDVITGPVGRLSLALVNLASEIGRGECGGLPGEVDKLSSRIQKMQLEYDQEGAPYDAGAQRAAESRRAQLILQRAVLRCRARITQAGEIHDLLSNKPVTDLRDTDLALINHECGSAEDRGKSLAIHKRSAALWISIPEETNPPQMRNGALPLPFSAWGGYHDVLRGTGSVDDWLRGAGESGRSSPEEHLNRYLMVEGGKVHLMNAAEAALAAEDPLAVTYLERWDRLNDSSLRGDSDAGYHVLSAIIHRFELLDEHERDLRMERALHEAAACYCAARPGARSSFRFDGTARWLAEKQKADAAKSLERLSNELGKRKEGRPSSKEHEDALAATRDFLGKL